MSEYKSLCVHPQDEGVALIIECFITSRDDMEELIEELRKAKSKAFGENAESVGSGSARGGMNLLN